LSGRHGRFTGRTASRVHIRGAGFKGGENTTFLIVRGAVAERHDAMIVD
jgi:hypothetical protein